MRADDRVADQARLLQLGSHRTDDATIWEIHVSNGFTTCVEQVRDVVRRVVKTTSYRSAFTPPGSMRATVSLCMVRRSPYPSSRDLSSPSAFRVRGRTRHPMRYATSKVGTLGAQLSSAWTALRSIVPSMTPREVR